MLDIGWSEMFVILVVALIVIGPKDLPRVARTVGKWVGKGRALAREFQNSIEDMAREAELDDVKKEIERAGRTDLKKTVENTIDPKGELRGAFEPGDRRARDHDRRDQGRRGQAGPGQAADQRAKRPQRDAPPGEVAGPPAPGAAGTAGSKGTEGQEQAPAAPSKEEDAEPKRVAAGSS